ncbi:MAG TPA: hypothetical protein ENN38_00245 [Actinobacteria bacterium]|nr:hypothetical protein [Actinomycetota bacterium]
MLTNKGFVDIHSHILPHIDDGSQSMEESLEIARLAVKNNIEVMVATPHFKHGFYTPSKEKILSSLKKLRAALKAADIPLEILPGSEAIISPEMIRPNNKQPLTLNQGHYMLVEFMLDEISPFFEEILFKLQLKNIKPIIAHPERIYPIIENPQIIYNLAQKGCLLQVNAASILGLLGKEIESLSHSLLKRGIVDFIASDVHRPNKEVLNLSKTVKVAAKYVGGDRARALVRENPLKIIKK